MKKTLAILIAGASLAACNSGTDNTSVTTDTTVNTSTRMETPVDTTSTVTTTTSTTTYTPMEGDVIYRNNKVLVMRNGAWVETDKDVKLDNGVTVYRTGKVRKDNKEIELHEGEVVNKSGNFFDKTGRAIDNAWDATKEGVKDAGKAIGNAAEKVGKKAKDVVTDDDKEKH